jgi:hypothetical protein
MDNLAKSQLILYSSLLTAGTSNDHGTANANMTEFLFTNINMRLVMGDLYDTYNLYNIALTTVITPLSAQVAGTTDSDRKLLVYMDGLGWRNNTYNLYNRNNTNTTAVGVVSFSGTQTGNTGVANIDLSYTNTVATIQTNNSIFSGTFGKNNEVVNIGICYKKAIYTNGVNIPNTTNPFPAVTFVFTIIGVPDYKRESGLFISGKNPDTERRIF